MKITVMGKNIAITDGLKNAVETKLSKLDKYFNPDVEVNATLSVQKNKKIIEVTIPFNGIILRGEEINEDMYAAVDIVLEKLERQIRKQKTKLQRKKHGDALKFQFIPEYTPRDDENIDSKIVKNKKFPMKPMNNEEALLQMELLGHSFFVYTNAETDEVNVLYKRKDGHYGLIEPQY